MRRAAPLLMYAGALAIVFGLAKVHAQFIGHYDFTGSGRLGWTIAYAGLLCLCAYGFGLPEIPRNGRAALGPAVGAAAAGALSMSLIQLVAGDALLPRFVVFGSALLLPDWFRVSSRIASGGRLRAEARDRVLLVAMPSEAIALEAELRLNPEKPASIAVLMGPEDARPRADDQPLIEAGAGATVVVLAAAAQVDDAIVRQAAELHARGLRVRTLTAFYEEWLGKVPASELERASMLFDIGEVHRRRYGRTKRLFDVALGSLGVLPLLVVLPVVAAVNRMGNRGPLFYRQERVGKRGAVFTILKLRTMRPVFADEPANEWTTEDDPRVTAVGRVLRATHLDELPQVLNVLRGDLSVVGPRPEQPRYVSDLSEKLPFYQLRHSVRPGITGWAQVKYGYAGSESDALEKLQYEFWYLRHQSMATDLRIVGRTLRSILGGSGKGR